MARRTITDADGNVYEQRRRGGCLKTLGIGFLIIIALGVLGGLLGGDESSTTENETNNTEEVTDTAEVANNEESTNVSSVQESDNSVEEEQIFGVGDTIQAGDLEVVVNGVSNTTAINTGFSEETPNTGNYLLVDITVTNNGNESQTIDSNNFKLVRGETVYDADSTATLYVNDDSTSFFLNSLNPEATLTGTVAFDISEDSASDSDLQLEISSNLFFGDKVYVNLNQ